jgi:co-chaperonin GroES (HSP10)
VISPLHDHYYAQRISHSGALGSSLVMPETSREVFFDARVISAGPGRIGDDGKCVPMQAEIGDRILCDPAAFQHYEPGASLPTHGFVSDAHLLGVIRAPDFRGLEPAGEWILIDPDPNEDVKLSEGCIFVSQGSLPGEESRRKERGYELVREYSQLLTSQRYQGEATAYDQWLLERHFIENLNAPDYECFAEALKEQRRKHAMRAGQSPELMLKEKENRAEAPLRMKDRVLSGVVRGIGPDARTDANIGDRCRWAKWHALVRISVGGVLRFLIPAGVVEAVLE